jgi:hypothetical protein
MNLKIIKNYDVILASICIVGLIVVIPLFLIKGINPTYIVADIVAIVCVGVWLILRKHLSIEMDKKNNFIAWLFLSLAGFSYVSAILSFVLRINQYEKPLLYYVFIAIASGFALVSILNVTNRKQVFILLGLACIIGLTHTWTDNLMFSNSLIGIDPWTHMTITTSLIGTNANYYTGISVLGGSYSLMHLYLKWIIDVFGLDYKWASLIFVGSLQVILNMVFIYLIGKELFNNKVGLLASLVMVNANIVIFFSEWITPNGIGVSLCLIVAYLFIKAYKSGKNWIMLLSLACLPIAYFTHVIVSLWVIGVIICMSVIKGILDLIKTKRINLIYNVGFPTAVIVSLFAWYRFSYINILSCVNAQQLTSSFSHTQIQNNVPSITQTLVGSTPLNIASSPVIINNPINVAHNYLSGMSGEMILDSMGMFLYFGLALIGIFIMLKYSSLHISWVVFSIGALIIGLIPPLLGITLLEHRWWYLAEAFMSLPLALALIRLAIIKKWVSISLVACLFSVIVFLSTIGLPSNLSNRSVSENLIVRYAFTENEMEGLQVAKSYNPKIIGSDPIFLSYIGSYYQGYLEYLEDYIINGNFIGCKADVLLLRNALYKEPFGFGSGSIYRLNYNPIEVAKTQGYKEVWNNSEISCLVKN